MTLDEERLDVVLSTWGQHLRDHRLMPDPMCIFCDEVQTVTEDHTYDPQSNTYYLSKGD